MKLIYFLIVALLLSQHVWAHKVAEIVVAKDGSGDYTSITEAVENLPYFNYQRIVILVKNGVYNEKIRLECDFITIKGESRDSTIIEYAQLREDWEKNKDSIGPAVINIHADDIILDNLTIKNTQPQIGPHAFTILGTGTRTIIINSNITSNGGDTVSLWDFKTGMYYHDNCYFEGAVDFVCPRGWCYISNSTFKELKNTAAVWHAATNNKNQRFVLRKCNFVGTDSFYLARHHYDAQFFFIDCQFSAELIDKPIERVTYPHQPEKNRPFLYGERYYFKNCKRKGVNYQWFADNLAGVSVTDNQICPEWTFENQWNPIDSSALRMTQIEYKEEHLYMWFDEEVMPVENLKVIDRNGKSYSYSGGVGSKRLSFKEDGFFIEKESFAEIEVYSGKIKNVRATVKPRYFKNY